MSMEKLRSEERKETQARIPLSNDQSEQVSGGNGSGIQFPNDSGITYPIDDTGIPFLIDDTVFTYTPDTSDAANPENSIGWP